MMPNAMMPTMLRTLKNSCPFWNARLQWNEFLIDFSVRLRVTQNEFHLVHRALLYAFSISLLALHLIQTVFTNCEPHRVWPSIQCLKPIDKLWTAYFSIWIFVIRKIYYPFRHKTLFPWFQIVCTLPCMCTLYVSSKWCMEHYITQLNSAQLKLKCLILCKCCSHTNTHTSRVNESISTKIIPKQ